MNSDPKDPQSADEAQQALSPESDTDSAPAVYAFGIVWPWELSIGSLEDQLEVVKRTQANGFHLVEAKLDQRRVVAVTPLKTAKRPPTADAVSSLLHTHRPRVVICTSALRVRRVADADNDDHGCGLDWARRNAVYAAESLQAADGSTLAWPLTKQLSETLHGRNRITAPWYHADAPWSADVPKRIVVDDLPAIVQAECELRAVPCLAIGVIRWLAGEGPSRELADYQASGSRAKKLGRMLRWAVKNRDAIRETAQAAEADLLAGDQLATELCALIKAHCMD